MTDQTAPDTTNHDRRLAHSWAETVKANPECWGQRQLAAARVILHYLPDPPRPTLADMLPKERAACQWLQADVANVETRAVIVNPNEEDGKARVVWPGGFNKPIYWEEVTPHPDVPCMEWPSDQKPAPAPALPDGWRLADHKKHGRVIVTNPTPDPSGHVYFVMTSPENTMGYDWLFCDPDELTYINTGQEADQ